MSTKIPSFKAHPLKKKILEAPEVKPCEATTPFQKDKSLSSVSNSSSSVSLDIMSNKASSFPFPILPSSMAASSAPASGPICCNQIASEDYSPIAQRIPIKVVTASLGAKNQTAKKVNSLIKQTCAVEAEDKVPCAQSSEGTKPKSVIKCPGSATAKKDAIAIDTAQENQAVKRQDLDGGRSRQEQAQFISTAEMVKKFQSRTTDNDFSQNKSAPHESAPTMIQSRPKLKLTRPKEPEFETAQRVHAIGVKSSAELEEEMLAKIPTFKAHPLKKKILEAPEAKPCETSTPLQKDRSLSSVSNSSSSVSLDIMSNEASSFAFPFLPSSMAASSAINLSSTVIKSCTSEAPTSGPISCNQMASEDYSPIAQRIPIKGVTASLGAKNQTAKNIDNLIKQTCAVEAEDKAPCAQFSEGTKPKSVIKCPGSATAKKDAIAIDTAQENQAAKQEVFHGGRSRQVLSDLAIIVLMVFFLPIAYAKYEGDIQALFSLRSSFSMRHDLIPSWFDAETAPCNWSGITCNGAKVETIDVSNIPLNLPIPSCLGQFQSLIYIAARGAGLIGDIPKELGYCKSLKHLDLSFNSLTGPLPENLRGLKLIINFMVEGNLLSGSIPEWISSWKLANTIYLGKNQFSGPLPSLKFQYLKTFSASDNRLSGDIPSSVCEAKSLSSLLLFGNNFTGRLMNALKGCSSLKQLDLSQNQLHGEIPDYLGELPLQSVILYSNNFSGPIPEKLWESQTITDVILNKNQLCGTISDSIGKSFGLLRLIVDDNFIEGTIPRSLGKLKNLTNLSLRQNRLVGKIPLELFDCEKLNNLDISFNNLSGTIPKNIANLENLVSLSLAGNHLSGQIPNEICTGFKNGTNYGIIFAQHLGLLDLSYNNLIGPIPSSIKNCSIVNDLRLQGNMLNGSIPSELAYLSDLTFLDLSYNFFTGSIPTWKYSMQNLQGLALSNNNLEGSIPNSLEAMLPNLVRLNLSNNHLVGTFPKSLFGIKLLEHIDISSNLLHGPILFSSTQSLVLFNGSNNHFSGEVYSISNLTSIYTLDLHNNNFTGSLPLSLCNFTAISYLDMSVNNLSGVIPCDMHNISSHPFVNFSGNNFSKEDYKSYGTNHIKSPLASPEHPTLTKAVIYGITFSVISVLTFMVLLYIFFPWQTITHRTFLANKVNAKVINASSSPAIDLFHSKKQKKDQISKCLATIDCDIPRVSLSGIFIATNNFDDANFIADGGFSTVYKAFFPESFGAVAIKRLNRNGANIVDDHELLAEMKTIGMVQHPNLLPLLGYCVSENERLLIYKYIKHGSLDLKLWNRSDTASTLDWPSRFKICVGTARGIHYAHHDCTPNIIHRDIKSANILLEENFEPVVADFGLARLICDDKTHISTILRGTCGYIPPEYALKMRATREGDVYSFGVVLLELLTGQPPIIQGREGGDNLVEWVAYMHKVGRQDEVFDPTLNEDVNNDIWREQMKEVLKIAMACVSEKPKERPTMFLILKSFEKLEQ